MSILEANTRPWTKFDAKNKVHRAYYAEFLRTQAWGHCPWRFFVEDEGGNLIGYIQRVLLEYYTEKEFGDTTGVERTDDVETIRLPQSALILESMRQPFQSKELEESE